MANILVFNYQIPYPEHFSGNTVRVLPLSREISKHHQLFLVCFGEKDERYHQLRTLKIFKDIHLVPAPKGRKSVFRHFYVKTGDQTRVSLPSEYRRIVRSLEDLIDLWSVDLILAHTSHLAEYVLPLSGIPKVMDAIDCNALALSRMLSYKKGGKTEFFELLKHRVALKRKRYLESGLSKRFDLVTVASKVDRDYLRMLSKVGQKRIIDVPNGINPTLLTISVDNSNEFKNAIGFWGDLQFPPNKTAVYYFYDNVFSPFLSKQGVIWFIIGKNPTDRIKRMARTDPNIRVTGFVENLFDFVSRIPIVINPMVIGGGIKNKVLEAFALRRLVISNTRGIEAIEAKDGIHYVHAETPVEFSEKILLYLSRGQERKQIGQNAASLVEQHYTWDKVGHRYISLLNAVIHRA